MYYILTYKRYLIFLLWICIIISVWSAHFGGFTSSPTQGSLNDWMHKSATFQFPTVLIYLGVNSIIHLRKFPSVNTLLTLKIHDVPYTIWAICLYYWKQIHFHSSMTKYWYIQDIIDQWFTNIYWLLRRLILTTAPQS